MTKLPLLFPAANVIEDRTMDELRIYASGTKELHTVVFVPLLYKEGYLRGIVGSSRGYIQNACLACSLFRLDIIRQIRGLFV